MSLFQGLCFLKFGSENFFYRGKGKKTFALCRIVGITSKVKPA